MLQEFGTRVQALLGEAPRRVDHLGPWCVARAWIPDGRGGESSVILKWSRGRSDTRGQAERLAIEAMTLAFLHDRSPTLAPSLLAWSTDLVIMEDVYPGRSLLEVLHAGSQDAATAYLAFAVAMGRLHGDTVGREAEWLATLAGATSPLTPPDNAEPTPRSRAEAEGRHLNLPLPREAADELDRLWTDLSTPGPFHALTNGDPGANNFLVRGDTGRLTDFEGSHYRHALLDAACLHVQHSVWTVMPQPQPFGVVEAYRTELAKAVPEALQDQVFFSALAGAAVVRTLEWG